MNNETDKGKQRKILVHIEGPKKLTGKYSKLNSNLWRNIKSLRRLAELVGFYK